MIVELVTAVMLALAAYFDFRTMRIPNALQIVASLFVWGAVVIFDPHSWTLRVIVMHLLLFLVLIAFMFNQSGAGDLKMMVWFGAGFSMSALPILVYGVFVASFWAIGKRIARKESRWVPLAPCLLLGLVVQKLI